MQKLKVEIIVYSDIKNVWKKWISPDSVKVWSHADDSWGVGNVENDIRIGGRFLTHMHALDNSAAFDFTGEYIEVELPTNKDGKYSAGLKYKMDKSENEVINRECEVFFESIESSGGYATATRIIEIFDPENINSSDMQRAGWQAILDNFKKYVESK